MYTASSEVIEDVTFKTVVSFKRGSVRGPTKPAGAKIFFKDFFSLNERSGHETYKSKILDFSDVLVKNGKYNNLRFFNLRPKNHVFHMLIVFWDFLCFCSSYWAEKRFERCRKEFSTKWSISVVITIDFSNRSSFQKRRGVDALWGSFY